jgi:3-oxoacyl-[acyl-carrier-protein] synthase-3
MLNARIRAGIMGVGKYVPEKILTNKELEAMVDTSDEWIVTRSGIRERRIAAPGEATTDLALEASKRALQDAKVEPGDIDLIIVATTTADYMFPAVACIIQNKLGARKAATFDMFSGCTGFIYAYAIAAQFINSGMYSRILLVGAETLSRITDYQDRGTCVLFGDGAGAAVIGPAPEGYGLIHSRLGADGSLWHTLYMPAGGARLPASMETVEKRMHYARMSGREIFKFAVKACGEEAMTTLKEAGISINDIDCLILHQANIRIMEAVADRLKVPMDKVFSNIDRLGNTAAASIPIALEEAVSQGKIKHGSNVFFVGFGAGLTWAVGLMRWYDYKSGVGS